MPTADSRALIIAEDSPSNGAASQTVLGAAVEGLHNKILHEFDQLRAWARLFNAVLRGAVTGFCLRGGLHLMSWLLSFLSKRRASRALPTLLDRLDETRRYTLFLATFAGLYVGVDEGLAAVFGKRRTAPWRALCAGAFAGPSLLLTGANTRHDSLAIYILLRGITLLIRCGNKPSAPAAVRKVLTPTRWEHGDTALMCLCTSQIGYSWILRPSTLPASFVRFLNHHGGKDLWYYEACREYSSKSTEGPVSTKLAALAGTEYEDLVAAHPCDWAHPGTTCNRNALAFLPGAYMRALPVYLPVYVLPALLVHRKALLRPETAGPLWRKILLGAGRSAAFLALYCTLAWRGACWGFQTTGTAAPPVIPGFCWTGGLATLVEKKSRRMELAIYCLSRASESFVLCLVEWGWLRPRLPPRRTDVLLFSLATAAIMHCYSDSDGQHRDVFRSKYLNVLDFIFGNSGHEANCIRHVPSTRELLAAVPVERVGLDRQAWRRRTSSLLGSLERLAEAAYEPLEMPREELTVVDFEAVSAPEGMDSDMEKRARESSERRRSQESDDLLFHRTQTAPGNLQNSPEKGIG